MAYPTRAHTFVAGDTLPASQLNTEFDIAINALATGTKDANIAALIASTLSVSTTTDFTGNVNAAANVNIGDSSSDTLKVNAVSVFNNAVTINAASTLNAAVVINAQSTFNAAIILNAPANITGSLNVSANANLAGNIVVLGNSTLGDASTDTLVINASSTFNNAITLGSAANITGSVNVSVDANIAGTLVAGNVTSSAKLNVATTANIVGNADFGAAANVVGLLKAPRLELTSEIGSGGTPAANTVYADLLPKAWAFVSDTGSLTAGAGLSVNLGTTGRYTYTLARAMANANYAILVTPLGALIGGVGTFTSAIASNTTSFQVQTRNSAGTLANVAHYVMVMGNT